jgi:hypothetical protein
LDFCEKIAQKTFFQLCGLKDSSAYFYLPDRNRAKHVKVGNGLKKTIEVSETFRVVGIYYPGLGLTIHPKRPPKNLVRTFKGTV